MRENVKGCLYSSNPSIHSVGINNQPVGGSFGQTVLRLHKAGYDCEAIADRTYITRNVNEQSKPIRTQRYWAAVEKIKRIVNAG